MLPSFGRPQLSLAERPFYSTSGGNFGGLYNPSFSGIGDVGFVAWPGGGAGEMGLRFRQHSVSYSFLESLRPSSMVVEFDVHLSPDGEPGSEEGWTWFRLGPFGIGQYSGDSTAIEIGDEQLSQSTFLSRIADNTTQRIRIVFRAASEGDIDGVLQIYSDGNLRLDATHNYDQPITFILLGSTNNLSPNDAVHFRKLSLAFGDATESPYRVIGGTNRQAEYDKAEAEWNVGVNCRYEHATFGTLGAATVEATVEVSETAGDYASPVFTDTVTLTSEGFYVGNFVVVVPKSKTTYHHRVTYTLKDGVGATIDTFAGTEGRFYTPSRPNATSLGELMKRWTVAYTSCWSEASTTGDQTPYVSAQRLHERALAGGLHVLFVGDDPYYADFAWLGFVSQSITDEQYFDHAFAFFYSFPMVDLLQNVLLFCVGGDHTFVNDYDKALRELLSTEDGNFRWQAATKIMNLCYSQFAPGKGPPPVEDEAVNDPLYVQYRVFDTARVRHVQTDSRLMQGPGQEDGSGDKLGATQLAWVKNEFATLDTDNKPLGVWVTDVPAEAGYVAGATYDKWCPGFKDQRDDIFDTFEANTTRAILSVVGLDRHQVFHGRGDWYPARPRVKNFIQASAGAQRAFDLGESGLANNRFHEGQANVLPPYPGVEPDAPAATYTIREFDEFRLRYTTTAYNAYDEMGVVR